MYKFGCITLLSLLSIGAHAQSAITGTVKNQDNKTIPYCSIGIKDSKTGTITDGNGNYKLEIPDEAKNKEIIFAAAGYSDKSIPANDLKTNSNIVMDYKVTNIEAVVMGAKKLKEKTIGQKSRPFLTFSKMFDQNVPTIEQGNIFAVYQKTRLVAYNFYIIPSSKFEQITMKLNIYSVKNNEPDRSLLQENVIYKTSTTGWQKIDLSEYKLNFKNLDKIAVTLQLVDHKALPDIDFVFGVSAKKSLSKNLLFRYQSQGNWEASEGSFITNLDIRYDKAKGEKDITEEQETDNNNDVDTKALISYYEHKKTAQKTVYGKNKEGKYIDLKDAKIYYEEYGKGQPLILLHGNNGSISDFSKQIPFFAKNYRVIAVDTRGQGRSTDLTQDAYSYEKFASDLYQVIKSLNLEQVDIIGWSDGGNTALIFNYEHPEMVNRIVTIGANMNPAGVKETLIEQLKKQVAGNDPKTNQRLIQLMLNHPDIKSNQLSLITNPVLVVAGSDDVIKDEHTRLIHKLIRNSELAIIPDATHYIPFEQPEKLNELMLNFLKNKS
ncbi:TPA: alpha/beta fold hydrolase [Elizabethkingia anophelis]|uniref:alpha/beta fold hydrolase n=1 Tax=Elizabethkingia anophelis TaxID=1117645 RepID=UPI00046544F9|nr:alpha/beta fold hydrolase [Elizabethkingia anophelis]MCT3744594.1 alpha/beta fold hydrolase [Elizabethkingia anophelis]MDC8026539.1 alpha/beta fold hydrolase [Elizabethkingia anophelis]MDV3491371.1 oxidoreductase [Elizabethkingia anophelis]MDV4130917.1 oxidoreductase [Elizabethkingia anophelis]MDV4134060.1 oxidoreductase [Elizabethkingia anophelis]